MPKQPPPKPLMLLMLLCALPLLGVLIGVQVSAQSGEPVPYTPGSPLGDVPMTLDPSICLTPLSLQEGDTIYIRAGVIVRNRPSRSGAMAWNTIYDSQNAQGELIRTPVAVPATIVEGPVCAEGLNWWRVTGTGNPGWVAEGRPDFDGGYLIYAPARALVDAPCPLPRDLRVGQNADLSYNVRIRENPSLSARTRTIAPAGSTVQIIGGAQCVEGFIWWGVRATVANFTYEGWMAQGVGAEDALQDYLIPDDAPSLEDGTLCAPPLRFSVGDRGYVAYRHGGPKSLRVAPSSDSTLLFSLVDGVPFVIAGGPVCRENLNWWQITVRSGAPVTGWMAEGSPGQGVGYWMRRLNPQ